MSAGEVRDMDAICGIDCGACAWRAECRGCAASCGRPFGGECIAANCCKRRGITRCAECGDRCALKRRAMAELNALGIPGMPEVTDLNLLKGSIVNIEYALPGGQRARFWDDDAIYLGGQLERPGSDRCFGLAVSDEYLLVCEYGEGGSNPQVLVYRKRSDAHD